MSCGCCGNGGYPEISPQRLQAGFGGSGFIGRNNPCRLHLPAVAMNFIAPAADVPINVIVTHTMPLFVGQGIKIGSGFYQVVDIIDAVTLTIQHSGLGIAAGTNVIAREPNVQCYQYPITTPGIVTLNFNPAVVALAADAATPIADGFVATVLQSRYGSLGARTIEYDYAYTGTMAAGVFFVAIQLPDNRTPGQYCTGSAQVVDVVREAGIAKFGLSAFTNYVLVGRSGENVFTAGADRKVLTSGRFEVAI